MTGGGETIRVMVVEDHPVVRRGMVSLIADEAGVSVVAEASTGEEAVELFRQHRPDVTLMDLRLPGMNGVDAMDIIRGEFPDSRFIALSIFDGDEFVARALEADAKACVLKYRFAEDILPVLRQVHAGERVLPVSIKKKVDEAALAPPPDLSAREKDILFLLVQGKSDREMANMFGIAEDAAGQIVAGILAKLGVPDRPAAAAMAIQQGIVKV